MDSATPQVGSLGLGRSAARWTKAQAALFSRAFAIGFAVAVLILLVASTQVLTGVDPAAAAGRSELFTLGLNLALIGGLAAYLGVRFWRLFKGRGKGDPAPKLHLKFAGLFSLVAVLPAVIVAVLLGALFTRGMDSWFSERTRSLVEDAVSVAAAYVRQTEEVLAGDTAAMATDLNAQAHLLRESRIEYGKLVAAQAEFRSFIAAYVIDSSGTVLSRYEDETAPPYIAPTLVSFSTADEGGGAMSADAAHDAYYALIKLTEYDDAYLYTVQKLQAGILSYLRSAETSNAAYAEAEASRGRLRLLYGLLYLETTLLVLIGAAGFGLSAANQVVRPVGRLVEAAERVRDGDFKARVDVDSEHDELAALSRAFNDMTGRLGAQHNDLVEATAEAERRSEFTEAVLSGVSAGVVGVDADNCVTLANRSALHLLGAGEEVDLTGQNVVEIAPEIAGIVRSARAAPGVVAEGQADLMRRGDVRRLNVRATASRDGSGAVVATFDDITRLVTDQRNAAWRDVARRIAHEIKNPLTPIQLSAERLRRKYLKDIQGEREIEVFGRCVDTIVRQVSDIGRMVDEFSSFARMPEPRPAPVEMTELVRSTAFTQRVATPSIEIMIDVPETPVVVFCDERLIAQALANVLKNASESLSAREDEEPGAKALAATIKVSLREEGGFAVVEVTDNGVGWPDAPREQLAEPYMTTRAKGTGLGLAIVRRVMEDHHGRLELADRMDGERGAVVRLALPLQARESEEPAEPVERVTV
jgi:two-component system nitrogen regulation sensor histidine kinase NtrY